ncbi:MAG: hypothetical protein Kapaf2KO_14790 [Candidatus Kapaibacteriales bacterium]
MKIDVVINGKKFTLEGEDPETVQKTANLVQSHIETLAGQYGSISSADTLPILAALNIAEEKLISEAENSISTDKVVSEINNLTEGMKQSLGKYV